jgi:hypothetical protein
MAGVVPGVIDLLVDGAGEVEAEVALAAAVRVVAVGVVDVDLAVAVEIGVGATWVGHGAHDDVEVVIEVIGHVPGRARGRCAAGGEAGEQAAEEDPVPSMHRKLLHDCATLRTAVGRGRRIDRRLPHGLPPACDMHQHLCPNPGAGVLTSG